MYPQSVGQGGLEQRDRHVQLPPNVWAGGVRQLQPIEDQAFFVLHQPEDVIREWVALVNHRTNTTA